MNAFQAAVIARLKAAGLLDVAERAARREELKLAHCIEPGENTGGHRALWRALAAAGKDNAQIAALVGRSRADIDTSLVPAAKPTPVPKSGERLRPSLTKAVFAAMLEEAVSPLRAELRAIRASLPGSTFDPAVWLDEHGESGQEIRAIASKAGVSLAALLGKGRSKHLFAVRREAMAYLSSRGLSHPEIGSVMRRDPSSVHWALMQARGQRRTRKKAA